MTKGKEEVARLVKKYGTNNPFELCEKLNINLNYSSLGSLKGFYRYSKRNHFIEINSTLTRAEQYVTCCHELGHYSMHQGVNNIFLSTTLMLPTKLEHEANRFALYMLLEYYGGYENIPSYLLEYLRS